MVENYALSVVLSTLQRAARLARIRPPRRRSPSFVILRAYLRENVFVGPRQRLLLSSDVHRVTMNEARLVQKRMRNAHPKRPEFDKCIKPTRLLMKSSEIQACFIVRSHKNPAHTKDHMYGTEGANKIHPSTSGVAEASHS